MSKVDKASVIALFFLLFFCFLIGNFDARLVRQPPITGFRKGASHSERRRKAYV